jgi:hypothetical protein
VNWHCSQRFSALRSGGLFSTALDTKNRTSIIHKIVNRSTSPRLTFSIALSKLNIRIIMVIMIFFFATFFFCGMVLISG